DNLSKLYRLGARGAGYRTLREAIANATVASWRWLSRAARGPLSLAANGRADHAFVEKPADTLWALKDVSFEVQPGEVVGIIGRNGAGKSTLLKILSRITEPTAGRVELRGRVGSLLEVGTGFHPELTGRENIFLNGAILGMTRREIQRKFDEIVAFAEIDDFLDTPVKRYSSGMYVRLAFAVAAHLEPEVLVVDEVLAVGDMAFQKKCLGKMEDVAQGGRTVLFVSHNMAAVEGLCQRGIVLAHGRLVYQGDAREAVRHYHHSIQANPDQTGHCFDLSARRPEHSHPDFQLRELRITSNGELCPAGYPIGAPLEFHLSGVARRPLGRLVVSFGIHRVGRGLIAGAHTQRGGARLPKWIEGPFTISCSVSDLFLIPGEYSISVGAKSGGVLIYSAESVGTLTILPTDFYGSGYNPDPGGACVLCRQKWEVKNSDLPSFS
ncbi:MAG TPA: polysaccharide ABC transporter ATP-binding protein, partial [Gemmataceae bacterium]|nr:polysaccharide ABC transporter ATP-binding protein [Gemmataceae bacterium]